MEAHSLDCTLELHGIIGERKLHPQEFRFNRLGRGSQVLVFFFSTAFLRGSNEQPGWRTAGLVGEGLTSVVRAWF